MSSAADSIRDGIVYEYGPVPVSISACRGTVGDVLMLGVLEFVRYVAYVFQGTPICRR